MSARSARRRAEKRDADAAVIQQREEALNRWTPFQLAETVSQRQGATGPLPIKATGFDYCLVNNRYTVLVRRAPDDPTFGPVIHLSIRRNDRGAARDWRDFQRIKNELIGDEAEAVELYPAESRLVDEANQFHLWVFPKYRFKFGFPNRNVRDYGGEMMGATQRPFGQSLDRE